MEGWKADYHAFVGGEQQIGEPNNVEQPDKRESQPWPKP
jgi:hypothetical protein